jgi:hypothetical protein
MLIYVLNFKEIASEYKGSKNGIEINEMYKFIIGQEVELCGIIVMHNALM